MIALARKYRPKRFADLIVQDHVAAALRGAVAQGRPAQGYLFAGPRGTGKTTAARILAMALNCERRGKGPEGEPCGECESCTRVWGGSASLDVVELDAASNRGVDDARDLRERALYAASAEGRYKVYIVDEAHMLTREAWNALLKVLEEPPPRVVFVFATTEAQKIQQTAAPVLSRLQRFDFKRIGAHAIVDRLTHVVAAEGLASGPDALQLIARSAGGGMRDALSLLDQVLAFGAGPVTAERVREVLGLISDDVYAELLRLVAQRDAAAVFPLIDRLLEGGADLDEFVTGAGEVLRAVLLTQLGGTPEGLTEGLQAAVAQHAAALPAEDVLRLLGLLAEHEPLIRQSGHPRLAVEVLVLRWAMMDRTVALGQVLGALGIGGKREGGGGKSGPAPAAEPPNHRAAEPPQMRDVARAPTPVPLPSSPVPASAEPGPVTLERFRDLWPRIVAHARSTGPMLASLLASSEVVAVEGGTITIRPTAAGHGHAEGLEHKRDALARALGAWAGTPVKVRVGGAEAGAARAPRLTPQAADEERLRVLRAKDSTLGAMVDALDLELME